MKLEGVLDPGRILGSLGELDRVPRRGLRNVAGDGRVAARVGKDLLESGAQDALRFGGFPHGEHLVRHLPDQRENVRADRRVGHARLRRRLPNLRCRHGSQTVREGVAFDTRQRRAKHGVGPWSSRNDDQQLVAEQDFVAAIELHSAVDSRAVDEDAVGAAQILNGQARVGQGEHGVSAGNPTAVQHELTVRGPSEHHRPRRDRNIETVMA